MVTLKACYSDVEEELYPNSNANCNITDVTYSLIVSPIISDNCFDCHSEASKADGDNIVLEGYANLRISVENESLLCSINHLSCASSPMPKGASKLKSCFIAQIEAWIADGYPEN